MSETLNTTKLKRELKIDAVGVGIPTGAAEAFIQRAIDDSLKLLKNKKIITEADLKRTLAKELKKYNRDLAYVFQNRDKII